MPFRSFDNTSILLEAPVDEVPATNVFEHSWYKFTTMLTAGVSLGGGWIQVLSSFSLSKQQSSLQPTGDDTSLPYTEASVCCMQVDLACPI